TRWNDGEFAKRLSQYGFGFSYSWLGMFSRKMDWYNLRMSFQALIKLPRLYFDFIVLRIRKKPDIIFFANHHELIMLLPALFFTRIRVVCHMHDPSPIQPFHKFTFRLYNSVVDNFIAISKDVKMRLVELGCDKNKIIVVYNGVELPGKMNGMRSEKFIQMFGWPSKSFVVGIIGQMTATKGHEDLVEAIRLALQKNSDIRLVI